MKNDVKRTESQGLRERNKARCRYRILKASRQLFSTKGYENTTIEDVAERAEISKATLYNYFPSKDSLLVGIANAELHEIHKLIAGELKNEVSNIEKLRKVLHAFVLDSAGYISLSRKITYLNSCEESELFSARLEMVQIFHQLVLGAKAQGELADDFSADEAVDFVMGIYLLSQFQWSKINDYSQEYCIEIVNRYFDRVFK